MESRPGESSDDVRAVDADEERELERLRQIYKSVTEEWITAIREEEQLAQNTNSGAAVDVWENAHLKEEEARKKAKEVRQAYQDGLRKALYGF